VNTVSDEALEVGMRVAEIMDQTCQERVEKHANIFKPSIL
jgi:hypothetical protein